MAIPSYSRLIARSRQSEAKIALAHAYTIETTFRIQSAAFTFCLSNIGYFPTAGTHYYATGFGPAGNSNDCAPNGVGNMACDFYNYALQDPTHSCWKDPQCHLGGPGKNCMYFEADSGVSSSLGLATGSTLYQDAPWSLVHWNKFVIGAVGNISSSGVWDVWTIDEQKNLKNVTAGY